MQRRLMLMRHAKSSWAEANMDDYDRPLNQRGKVAAPQMGTWIRHNARVPELILASTAARVAETTNLITQAMDYQGEIQWVRDLYLASPSTILQTIGEVDDQIGSVLVVGHNPGLEQLVSAMCGQFRDFPTAALASFQVALPHWKNLIPDAESLVWIAEHFITPKGMDA